MLISNTNVQNRLLIPIRGLSYIPFHGYPMHFAQFTAAEKFPSTLAHRPRQVVRGGDQRDVARPNASINSTSTTAGGTHVKPCTALPSLGKNTISTCAPRAEGRTDPSPAGEISSVQSPTWFVYWRKSCAPRTASSHETRRAIETTTHLEHGHGLLQHRAVVLARARERLDAPRATPCQRRRARAQSGRATTHQRVQRQNVPSSPPTPSSVFVTS